MKPEDIQDIEGEYARVHAVTPHVLEAQLSPQTLSTIDQHQRDLNEVIGSLESLETHYDGIIKSHQVKLARTKDMRRMLERDFDDSKRKYWTVRKDFERSPL
jgi:hypothetical protein